MKSADNLFDKRRTHGLMYIPGTGCQSLPSGHSQNAREGGGAAEGLAAAQHDQRLFPSLEP